MWILCVKGGGSLSPSGARAENWTRWCTMYFELTDTVMVQLCVHNTKCALTGYLCGFKSHLESFFFPVVGVVLFALPWDDVDTWLLGAGGLSLCYPSHFAIGRTVCVCNDLLYSIYTLLDCVKLFLAPPHISDVSVEFSCDATLEDLIPVTINWMVSTFGWLLIVMLFLYIVCM